MWVLFMFSLNYGAAGVFLSVIIIHFFFVWYERSEDVGGP